MTIHAGFGKADLTVFERGMPMLGWGQPDNVSLGVSEPLHARALALSSQGRTLVYVVLDLCFVSGALRAEVLGELERRGASVAASDLMLTATHTHSGPNGFSHAFFYDLSALGYSRRVMDHLVEGTVRAIEKALGGLEPARLRLGESVVEENVIVNRSVLAFRRNPEGTGEGVDRRSTVLRVDDQGGRALGMLNFFALHGTSIHSRNTSLHPDHKGLAAERFEEWARGAGHASSFVALFAQGSAGDASPNVRMDRRRGLMVGPLDASDEDNARYVADAQVHAARRAFESASRLVDGALHGAAERIDMEARVVGSERTTSCRLGLAMAQGTAEGPGPLARLPLPRRAGADPKIVLLEAGPGRAGRRLFGRFDPARLALPHDAFRHAKRAADQGGGLEGAWIPTVLPIQLLRIGELTIVGLPNEPTLVAGRRIAHALRAILGGIVHVQGYANAYAGYLTTPEEYLAQRYEGAYTPFGPRTLDAFVDALEALARKPDHEPMPIEGPALQLCSAAQLRARAWQG